MPHTIAFVDFENILRNSPAAADVRAVVFEADEEPTEVFSDILRGSLAISSTCKSDQTKANWMMVGWVSVNFMRNQQKKNEKNTKVITMKLKVGCFSTLVSQMRKKGFLQAAKNAGLC